MKTLEIQKLEKIISENNNNLIINLDLRTVLSKVEKITVWFSSKISSIKKWDSQHHNIYEKPEVSNVPFVVNDLLEKLKDVKLILNLNVKKIFKKEITVLYKIMVDDFKKEVLKCSSYFGLMNRFVFYKKQIKSVIKSLKQKLKEYKKLIPETEELIMQLNILYVAREKEIKEKIIPSNYLSNKIDNEIKQVKPVIFDTLIKRECNVNSFPSDSKNGFPNFSVKPWTLFSF